LPIASDGWAVRFDGVSKRFRRQEGGTLKEFVPAFLRGQGYAPDRYALRGVSFEVARGQTLGIVGRNGSGKTTILRLIGGVMAPTGGEVWVRGRVSPLLELGAGFHPDLTGRENVFLNAAILGMTTQQAGARFDQIVEFAELRDFMDLPVKRYSSGMYLRLAFAIAVHSDPDILLVDDALAVGDAPFQDKCFARLLDFQRRGVTIVLVSHVADVLRHFCHALVLLDGGRLVAEGHAEPVLAEYRSLTEHPPLPPGPVAVPVDVVEPSPREEGSMTMRQMVAAVAVLAGGLAIAPDASAGPPVPEEAKKTAETWLALWDAGKTAETYAALSEETTKSIPEAKWREYWTAVRKPLGTFKSRQLTLARTDTLPTASAREGAMLQYQSAFENKPSGVETIGMVRDLDGAWRVANYLVQ
jgi:ABC-type polysaccharide/polyol phosphate transport system ATPase subunit